MIELSDEEKLYRDVTLRSSSKQVILTDAVGVCAVVDGSGINEISKMIIKIFAFITVSSHTLILRLPPPLYTKGAVVYVGGNKGSVVYGP